MPSSSLPSRPGGSWHSFASALYLLDQKHIFSRRNSPALSAGDSPGSLTSLQEYLYMASHALRRPGQRSLRAAPVPLLPGLWRGTARGDQPCAGPWCGPVAAAAFEAPPPSGPPTRTVQYPDLGSSLPCPSLPTNWMLEPRPTSPQAGRRRECGCPGCPPASGQGPPGMLQELEPDTRSHRPSLERGSCASGPSPGEAGGSWPWQSSFTLVTSCPFLAC